MNCAKHTDVAATAYCRTCGKALCNECTRTVQGTIYCEDCLAARINNPAAAGATAQAAAAPAPTVVVGEGSPGLAALLGFIPGVGAMYNGQFVKGFIHVIVFVSLIWITDHGFELMGIGIAAWVFYMVFDAYTTAKARKYGMPLPDPLGINRAFGGNEPHVTARVVSTGEAIGAGVEQTVNNVRQNWQGPYPAGNPYAAPGAAPYVATAPVYVEQPAEPAKGIPGSAVVLIVLGCVFLLGNLGLLGFEWMHRLWPLFLIGFGLWLLVRRTRAARQ